MNEGDWVRLPDLRVARITSWDPAAGSAIAKTTSGALVDRPITFAEVRWQPVPPDGLLVGNATNPDEIRETAQKDPLLLVVMAMRDAGGEIRTPQLRDQLTPEPIPAEEWEPWWKRAQIRVEEDDRIDSSRSREQLYRLPREGAAPRSPDLRPAKQSEGRDGRAKADAPQLRRARERASKGQPFTTDELALFDAELGLATDTSVDATDRFMAVELGIWLERYGEDDARATLGDDVLAIDFLRIPGHTSRSLAATWIDARVTAAASTVAPESPSFRSAVAVGPPWSDEVTGALARANVPLRPAMVGALGWAVPGSDEAGPHKYPDDLETFQRRFERVRGLVVANDAPRNAGLWEGAVRAIEILPWSQKYDADVRRLQTSIAAFAWSCWHMIDAPSRPNYGDLGPLRPEALTYLIRAADGTGLKALERPLIAWFAADPAKYSPALKLMASDQMQSPAEPGLRAARSLISQAKLEPVSRTLLRWLADGTAGSDSAAQIVNLAVTAIPDDPEAVKLLDDLAEAAARDVLAGREAGHGPVTFSKGGWPQFIERLRAQLDEAAAGEARAKLEVEKSQAEIEQLRRLAERRTELLTEARSAVGERQSLDSARLAATLLKPVALALADSYQANSVEALRDRLWTVLQRARFVEFAGAGELVEFDPTRHEWIGEGYPTDEVKVASPGFAVTTEGEDDVVVVPARVVAP